MARFDKIYISDDILATGITHITGITTVVDSNSTDNEIPTAKAVYDTSSASAGLLEIKLAPTPAIPGDYASFTGTFGGIATDVTITADNTGSEYNIVIGSLGGYIYNGTRTIAEGIILWNSNNPTLSITFTSGDDTQVPANKSTFTMSGGSGTEAIPGIIGPIDEDYLYGLEYLEPIELSLEDILSTNNETNGNDIYLTPGDKLGAGADYINTELLGGLGLQSNKCVEINVGTRTIGVGTTTIFFKIGDERWYFSNAPGRISYNYSPSSYLGTLDFQTTLTASRQWTLPDATGTIALTSDALFEEGSGTLSIQSKDAGNNAYGDYSFTTGSGCTSSGVVSFNHSYRETATHDVSGATGNYSAILGGKNNTASGEGTVVLGCNEVVGTQDYTLYCDNLVVTNGLPYTKILETNLTVGYFDVMGTDVFGYDPDNGVVGSYDTSIESGVTRLFWNSVQQVIYCEIEYASLQILDGNFINILKIDIDGVEYDVTSNSIYFAGNKTIYKFGSSILTNPFAIEGEVSNIKMYR